MADSGQNENAEFIIEFVKESRDVLADLEVNIITLGDMAETDEIDSELINSVFRAFHSIKGGAGFLDLKNIQDVAHGAENLLDKIRSGDIPMKKDFVDKFVSASDFISDSFEYIEENFTDDAFDEEAKALKSVFKDILSEYDDFAGDTEDTQESVEVDVPSEEKSLDSGDNQDFTDKSSDGEDEFKETDNTHGFEITEDMVDSFVVESRDILRSFEENLIHWSESPEDNEIGKELFRQIHTVKGNAGFFSYRDIEKLGHYMEALIDVCLSEKFKVNRGQVIKILLQFTDVLNKAVSLIETEHDSDGSIEHLELYLELIEDTLPKGYDLNLSDDKNVRLGDILTEDNVVSEEDIKEALRAQQRPLGEILVELGKAKSADIEKALEKQKKANKLENIKKSRKKKTAKVNRKASQQDIRVDVSKLDNVINLISELVISSNMVVHNPEIENLHLESFTKASLQMGKIVRELQETAMTIRMIPVSGLFKRMYRLVHDLSSKCGKSIDFEIKGESTEIDKTVIELITDPLVHVIRNAIDHGIEKPEEREKIGKPSKGSLTLKAKHEEGEVWIMVEDDGKGIDQKKVLESAIKKGIVKKDEELKKSEILKLILHPGFSTAEKITDVSGRGVGMDVVKKNLEKIKGKVDIESTEGKGTRVLFRIPLTLAILEGMRVRVGTQEYIIPLLAIKQFQKVDKSQVTNSPDGVETIKIRGQLYPVYRLYEVYNLKPEFTDISDGVVLVVESDKKTAVIFVDEIIGQLQTVIKGLPENIDKVHGVSGCTILGSGKICLIIDIDNLLKGFEY